MLITENRSTSNVLNYLTTTRIAMINSIHIEGKGLNHYPQLQKAIYMANELFHNEAFYNRISRLTSFDFADVSPAIIAALMRTTRVTMNINVYYALSPVKKYDGYDDAENPTAIHLNAWKLDRSPESICNTLVHYCVHAINAQHKQYSFGHGDMILEGKWNSAPYRIGMLAQEMLSIIPTDIIPLAHDPYEAHVKEFKKAYSA